MNNMMGPNINNKSNTQSTTHYKKGDIHIPSHSFLDRHKQRDTDSQRVLLKSQSLNRHKNTNRITGDLVLNDTDKSNGKHSTVNQSNNIKQINSNILEQKSFRRNYLK